MNFSIILPTIGRDSLQNAINSVLAQTYQNWHLYIVADGCNPSIFAPVGQITLMPLAQSHNDSGAFARNFGIAHSSEEWITFLDDDDEYLPNALKTVSEIALSNPECSMIKTCGQMFKMGYRHPRSSEKIRKLGQINNLDIMTIGIACKRELFNLTKGWGSDVNQHDRILWNDMLAAGGVPVISNEVTFLYQR